MSDRCKLSFLFSNCGFHISSHASFSQAKDDDDDGGGSDDDGDDDDDDDDNDNEMMIRALRVT